MKLLLETTGNFQLMSDERGVTVPWNRPAVLASSHFTQQFVASGKLRVLHQVSDEATDAEFAKYWTESEGDHDLAVASFAASFPLEPVEAPKARKVKAE